MIDQTATKTVRMACWGFPVRRTGETPGAVWFPALASFVLVAVVVAVHWSVWDAFAAELGKNAPIAIPLVAVLAAIVLLPPLAWAVGAI